MTQGIFRIIFPKPILTILGNNSGDFPDKFSKHILLQLFSNFSDFILTRYQNADPCQSPHFLKHGPHLFKHGPHLFKQEVRIFFKHKVRILVLALLFLTKAEEKL